MPEESNVSPRKPVATRITADDEGSDAGVVLRCTSSTDPVDSMDAVLLPAEPRFRQVAPLTWLIDDPAPTAQEEADAAERVNARGGAFLISRGHYIDVRRLCRCKTQFDGRMSRLREPRPASELAAAASHAGWQLAEYVQELARAEDEACFDLLRWEPILLGEVPLRQAFVHGFSTSVESRFDEDEERFPGSERALAAQKRRTAFIARLRAYVERQVQACFGSRVAAVGRVSERAARQWAEDWFAGAAYCPRCKSDHLLAITSSSSDYAAIVETWTCGCGHSWKIEFQETAATANADAEPHEWIERYQSSGSGVRRRLSSEARSTIDAAIARLCDASFACGEWTRDSAEPWATVYRESVAARLALEALCARALLDEPHAGGCLPAQR